MSFISSKFGIDLSGGALHIVDLDDHTCRVAVDQVVFDAVSVKGAWAIGHLVSVHGFPQELFELLPAQVVRQLGIGPQFRAGRGPRGTLRFRACAGESNFKRLTHA